MGFISAAMNTVLNYGLIFGNMGLPKMGVRGAAYASVISQVIGAAMILILFFLHYGRIHFSVDLGKEGYWQYLAMLLPVVVKL